jgi:hypothetical protein
VLNTDRHGLLETTFEDIGRECGWAWKKTTQRAIAELEVKRLIEAKRASNQHGVTRISILNCDRAEQKPIASIADKHSAEDTAEDKNHRGGLAVEDAAAVAIGDVAEDKNNFAEDRAEDKTSHKQGLADELTGAQRKVLEHLGFQCDPRYLSRGFVAIAAELHVAHAPGKCASWIISKCLDKQKAALAEGKDPAKYSFPPGFQSHRDRLRLAEKATGRGCRSLTALELEELGLLKWPEVATLT